LPPIERDRWTHEEQSATATPRKYATSGLATHYPPPPTTTPPPPCEWVKEREGTANKIIESYVCPFVHPLSHLWVGGLGGSVGSVVQWLNTNFPTAMANAVKCDSDAHEPARQCIHKCARVLREGHFVRGFHFAYAQWLTKCNICMWGVPSKATCIISEISIMSLR